ncbi:MAG: hypothetical protein F6K24_13245 [Okeania sp. SIO2D1]|nr:hypothetical protein [Okeania sp. SIO2D1]
MKVETSLSYRSIHSLPNGNDILGDRLINTLPFGNSFLMGEPFGMIHLGLCSIVTMVLSYTIVNFLPNLLFCQK